MRSAPLTTIKGGINRLRTKGGARADTLYDLLNGYVTEAGTVVVRPGTRRVAVLDELTRGLVAFGDTLHTFASEDVAVPAGYTLNLIVHPEATEYDPIALEKIHFAEPFMGALYVVAEFEDGAIYHYWLQVPATWAADSEYSLGQLVSSSTDSRLVFQATRYTDPYPAWAPNVQRSADVYDPSIVEPTVYNGYYYVCVQTEGDNPVSGTTEPLWPTEDGAQISENVDVAAESTQTTSTPPPTNVPSTETQDRYGTPGTETP